MVVTVCVFGVVYLGMLLGRLPWLKVDRAAICLLGVIVLLASESVSQTDAVGYVGYRTVELLFGLMLVSAQFSMSGGYAEVTRRIVSLKIGPRGLLGVLILAAGVLSALLSNDVVALAMAPVLLALCLQKRLNPAPFLIGMAGATNAGATATIIGSPQNMLIGEQLHLSFLGFMVYTAVPAVMALLVIWGVICVLYRGRWDLPADFKVKHVRQKGRKFEAGETLKGALIALVVVGLFVFTDFPRSLVALAAGGLILLNGRYKSRKMLDRVDWQLLVLFLGLFVVNGALNATGLPREFVTYLSHHGVDLGNPVTLFVATAVLSDLVSNVPAVMLLTPYAEGPLAGPAMALAAGMASNLIVVGSIANIIVVDAAARRGVKISFAEHAKTGVPVTVVSLALSAGWLWCLSGLGEHG